MFMVMCSEGTFTYAKQTILENAVSQFIAAVFTTGCMPSADAINRGEREMGEKKILVIFL